jgi:hypothetical protein
MEKKILIYDDVRKFRELEEAVQATCQGGNELIEIFESFQTWRVVKTLSDFQELVSDPIGTFDTLLIKNSGLNLQATGGLTPKPASLADLLNIDRVNYIALITGEKVGSDCKGCSKLPKIQKSELGSVMNSGTFARYRDYLLFNEKSHRFIVNEVVLSEKKKDFQIFATTPDQIAVYNYWHELCDKLNEIYLKGYAGPDLLNDIAKRLNNRLIFNFQNYKLMVEETGLLSEILLLNEKSLSNG